MTASSPTSDHQRQASALIDENRGHLAGVAYRMLGTHSEVEDVLQEAYLRLSGAKVSDIEHPRAYLTKVVTRLCIDYLRSARVRREQYVGPWLPEPIVVEGTVAPTPLPDADTARREDISLALMFALERLSPLERAAFILHDVFEVDYHEISECLQRDPAACRQLAARARKSIKQERPRFSPGAEDAHALFGAFATAAMNGDLACLQTLFADDVIFASDGGGKVRAATKVVEGTERVCKLVIGLATKHYAPGSATHSPALVNGQPGVLIRENGRVTQAMAVDIRDGVIAGIYSVRNPDKLQHLNSGAKS